MWVKRLSQQLLLCLLVAPQPGAAAEKQDHSVPTAIVNSQPGNRPFRAKTSFSTALQCMDRLLFSYGKQNISIMAEEFADPTGTIKAGARSMFVDSLAAMSETSNAFTFVDLDVSKSNVLVMRNQLGGKIASADYYLSGSFVRSDQGISEWGRRIGAAIQQISIGNSKDQMVSVIGLDMGIADTRSGKIFNDVRTSNEIAVVRKGKSNQAELLLPFASLGYDMHADTSEGTHEAVRTLIDLSAIEIVGKFTRVPYWKCLEVPETDPTVVRVAQSFFYRMQPRDQIVAIQRALFAARAYTGAIDGLNSPALGDAVARYRVAHNLAANTSADFDVYFSLLNEGHVVVQPLPAGEKDKDGTAAMSVLATRTDPLKSGLTVNITPSATSIVKGDTIHLSVTVNQDAYVYCYITGPDQAPGGPPDGVRIFPNQFMPNPFVKANEPLTIPDNDDDIRLRFNDPGVERVMCLARKEEFTNPVPRAVSMPDLKPLNQTISEIEYDLQATDRKALQSAVKVVQLYVVEKAQQ